MRSTPMMLLCAAGASATIRFAGLAESGGEFAVWSATSTVGTGLPGRFGIDYAFINEAAIDTFVEQKVNFFRVAFLLERMCPLATGLGSTFNETHFSLYKEAIDYITVTKGQYAALDPHNYMRYNNPSSQPYSGSVIGNTSDPAAATTEQFGEFWGELASRFKDNDHVIFELMNEPHDMPTTLVLANNQAAVDAIRKAGATNMILVPGNQWTGGHSWTENWGGDLLPNSDYMYKINDTANNWAIDIHEYLDTDESGSHLECTKSFNDTMGPLTSWLQQHNLSAMVTEFGGSNTTTCSNMLTDALGYMANHTNYIGWSAWAAGPLWGSNSPCCTSSALYGSLEPGSKAGDGGPSLYDTVWLKLLLPLLPKTLQTSGPVKSRRSC